MSNYLLKGTAGANAVIGTADAGYSAIGTIISAERKNGSKVLEIEDRYGNVVVVIYFDYRGECSIDVIFDSTVTLPVQGDAISLCGVTNALCMETTLKWDNKREKMVNIKATLFANLALS